MRITRRQAIWLGGGALAALGMPGGAIGDHGVAEIAMAGRPDGSRVWFDPVGMWIEQGQTVRWINRDAGNAHTATAYHPANFDKPARIPAAAAPWDSDYLLPGDSFTATLRTPGVYDYYCVPHEMAGMVGRIVVGDPEETGWPGEASADTGLPAAVLDAFPAVEEIVRRRRIRRTETSVSRVRQSWG